MDRSACLGSDDEHRGIAKLRAPLVPSRSPAERLHVEPHPLARSVSDEYPLIHVVSGQQLLPGNLMKSYDANAAKHIKAI